MRSLSLAAGVFAALSAGCVHRRGLRIGEEVIPPPGLDSAGTPAWVAQQRARFPGELHFNVDHMPTVSLDGSPAPYQSGIISVGCAPRPTPRSQPSA
jgi:hypothetical protein